MSNTIPRIEATKRQIDAAVRAYFSDDLVSALTLAGAAERVLSDMQPKDGIFGADAVSLRSMINLYIKSDHQGEVAKKFRNVYDQLRHADRNTADNLEIKEEAVETYMLHAVMSFEFITKDSTELMEA